MNPDGVHLNVIAGPKLPNEWTRQMELLPIGPCAGSCGTAAYRGSQVIVSDIATDPLWNVPEHRAAALRYGLRASWSNPVLSWKGDVLGTFCMYYREPRSPTSQDLELIELATHLVRVAIERDRAQEALRASEQLARSHVEVMMRSLDVLATESAPEKFIGEMLRTIGQHLRFRACSFGCGIQQDDSLRLHLMIENDQQVADDPDHPFVRNPHAWKKSALFQEMLFTKSPAGVRRHRARRTAGCGDSQISNESPMPKVHGRSDVCGRRSFVGLSAFNIRRRRLSRRRDRTRSGPRSPRHDGGARTGARRTAA